ncbi:MAG: polyprenyl synthetase family protein [Bacteroidales bacterium]|nr:polyprenyl synthetase family protein [Bacteroidales bacterium]
MSLEEIKKPIAKELKEFDAYFSSSVKGSSSLLNIVTHFILRKKGKQMRPMFVFLTSDMLGGINPRTYTAATLIELLHTATLIHDDVVDESFERRGFFTVNALWKSKVAVLTGDYLLAKGLLLTVKNKDYDMLEIVSRAVRDMSEGELDQIQKTKKLNITEKDYFSIIRMKTASLFSACTECGAMAVTGDKTVMEAMRRFGEAMGIAFQIRDDIFDYQYNGMAGKPMGNDLKEKKLTLPVIYTLSQSSPAERMKLRSAIRRAGKDRRAVREIIDLVNDKRGIDYAVMVMEEYKQKALAILKNFPDNQARHSLMQLAEYAVGRKK